MTDERLVEGQRYTNLLLAFIAGSIAHNDKNLSAFAEMAFWFILAGTVIYVVCSVIWSLCNKNWANVGMVVSLIALFALFLSNKTFS